MERALHHLLTAPPEALPLRSLDDWWARHAERARAFADPFELALAAGFAADRVGYAFASGYQAAAHALFGPSDHPAALAATEKGSAHPRAIATRLSEAEPTGWQLDGEKSFVTLGSYAQRLLVVARRGDKPDGRPELCVVAIDRRRGVTLVDREPTAFAPEIPHARLLLDAVPVAPDELLPGDGYAAYLKPFRTVEDTHVLAALLGYLVRVARTSGWPETLVERVVGCAAALCAIAHGDPSSAAVHVALAGALALVTQLLEDAEPFWEGADQETSSRWQRDRVLLEVANSARAQRREAAWRQLMTRQ